MTSEKMDKWEQLAEAKLELVQLKKELIKREHEIKTKHMAEQHELIVLKLKLEIEQLKENK